VRSVAIHSDLWVRFAYKVGPKSREGGIGRGRALDRGAEKALGLESMED
jgi:hypothetical protein